MHALPAARQYAALMEGLFDAAAIISTPPDHFQPRIVYTNAAFRGLFRQGHHWSHWRRGVALRESDPSGGWERALKTAWCSGQPAEGRGIRYGSDGARTSIRFRAVRLDNRVGRRSRLLLVVESSHELVREQRHSSDLAAVIRIQQEVLSGGLELTSIRQRVVDVVRSVTGADAAMVAEPEADSLVITAASSGSGRHLGSRLALDASLAGHCFREHEAILCDDTRGESRLVDRAVANAVGFRSGVLVPLLHKDRCLGVLNVFSGRPHAFEARHKRLLEMASILLAAALNQARGVETESRRRQSLVDSLPILISYVSNDRRYREINATYLDWFGEDATGMPGKSLQEALGEAAYESIRTYVDAALRGEQVSYEAVIPYRGQPRAVEATYIPHRGLDGDVEGFFAVVRDIEDRKRADTDYLTGAMSRFRLELRAADLMREAVRYDHPLSLIILDIDHFKRINDSCGHQTGDDVLRSAAELVHANLREVDAFGRWGGEEFVIVTPENEAGSGVQLAERLRRLIARRTFGPAGRVTASFGVAQLDEGESFDALLARADHALYQAKQNGRNRVVTATHSRSAAL